MKTMTPRHLKLIALVFVFAIAESCQSQQKEDKSTAFKAMPASTEFDLVIINGRVMDPETSFDAVRNVGIKDGTIGLITEEIIAGKRTIDASGHVVSPGFIDFHVHGQDPYGFRLMARDGVTSPLELEMGAYPMDEFYDYWEGNAILNYGASVSHAFARIQVLDSINPGGRGTYSGMQEAVNDGSQWKSKKFTPSDVPIVLNAVEEGLNAGGLGIAFPIGYYSIVGSPEVTAVAGLANKHESFITSHVRYLAQSEPSGYLAMEEVLTVAHQNDVPLFLFHIPSNCLSLTGDCLDLIDRARERGQKVIGEFYPYQYAGTYVDADYLKPGYQDRLGIEAKDIIVTNTGKPLTDEEFDRLRKEDPVRDLLMYTMKEEYIMEAMKRPGTVVGCDAMPYVFEDGYTGDWDKPFGLGNGHVRGAGTHAKILRMVRETQAITLMEAIEKMTYGLASFAEDYIPQLQKRGRMQEGMVADITIFNPETVTDNATPEIGKNSLPSTGIPYVIVNGKLVVDNSVVQRVPAGVAIRNTIKE